MTVYANSGIQELNLEQQQAIVGGSAAMVRLGTAIISFWAGAATAGWQFGKSLALSEKAN